MIHMLGSLDSGHKVRFVHLAQNIHSLVIEVTPLGGRPRYIHIFSDDFARFVDYAYVDGAPVRRALDPISIIDRNALSNFLRKTAVSFDKTSRATRRRFLCRPRRPSFRNVRFPFTSCP